VLCDASWCFGCGVGELRGTAGELLCTTESISRVLSSYLSYGWLWWLGLVRDSIGLNSSVTVIKLKIELKSVSGHI